MALGGVRVAWQSSCDVFDFLGLRIVAETVAWVGFLVMSTLICFCSH